jgi:cyanophycinase-like exopeptidase
MEGLIRKIVIGQNPKDGMAYYVGMKVGDGSVSAIVLDDEHLHRHRMKRYLVYIKRDDGQVLWKAIDEMPCLVEFDLNF